MIILDSYDNVAAQGGAPQISRKLPKPDIAIYAGAMNTAKYFDLSNRSQRDWATSNFRPVRTPVGRGMEATVSNASSRTQSNGTRDLDGAPMVTCFSVWVDFLGTGPGQQIYLYEAGSNNRIRIGWGAAGLLLTSYGTYGTNTTIIPKADYPLGLATFAAAMSTHQFKLYMNGKLIYTLDHVQAWLAAPLRLEWYYLTGSGSEAITYLLQAATWTGYYDEFAKYLSKSHESLWEPRRIWLPVDAGGPTAPTLSLPTLVNITAMTATPRVTITV